MTFETTRDGPGGQPTKGPNLRFHRLAEQVADHLRKRILHGDLEDGMYLPTENELRKLYPVSKPAMREAMRILETEGLVTVRRGNLGGAVVHRPEAANVAYTLGLVLASKRVSISVVAEALLEVEPACVALCALREDRHTVIVPRLNQLQAEAIANVGDLNQAIALARRFHETLVELCGNQALIIMIGALETIWSSHETNWGKSVTEMGSVPVEERLAAIAAHQQVIDHVASGDFRAAREAVAIHLKTAQAYTSSPDEQLSIDPTVVRDRAI